MAVVFNRRFCQTIGTFYVIHACIFPHIGRYYQDMELEEMLADMYECLNLAKYHKRKLVLT
jgi:hypothetical protein